MTTGWPVLAGICTVSWATAIWLVRALSRRLDFDRHAGRALRVVADDREPDVDPDELWVARLRRQAELDAIDAAMLRHPAGRRRR